MKKYLPPTDFHNFHELRSGRQNSFGKNTFGAWRGSTNVIRPAVVCQQCNNGWMSIVETQVKESLIPLMAGRSLIIADGPQRTISRWATIKTMVYECNTQSVTVCTDEDHHEFRKTTNPNAQWCVWIAKCQAPNWRVRIMRQATGLGLESKAVGVPKPPNVQFLTIALDNLLIHLRQNKQTVFSLPSMPEGFFQIWPLQRDITWPPTRILNGTEAEFIGTSLFRALGIWPTPAYGLPPDGSRVIIRRE